MTEPRFPTSALAPPPPGTSMPHGARRAGPALVGAGVVAVVALFGGLVGFWGLQALLIVLGLGLVVLVWFQPFAGLLLLSLVLPIENMVSVGGTSYMKLVGAVVFFAWAGRKLLLRGSWRRIIFSRFTLASVLFLLFVLASSAWAPSAATVRRGLMQLGMLFGLSLLIIDLARSHRRCEQVVYALLAGGVLAASLTIWQAMLGARRAGESIAGGVNQTALVLVVLIPLGFYALRSGGATRWRLLGTVYVALAVAAVSTTFSRMNFLILPPLLLFLLFQALRTSRSRGWVLALSLAAVLAASQFVPWERVQERVETIGPYIQETLEPGSTFAGQSSGRGYHLRVGLAIARDHPIVGAGYDAYGRLFREEYQYVVRGDPTLYGSDRSPHSSYIALLADLGIVGLILWLFVLGAGCTGAVRVWWSRHMGRTSPIRILGGALSVALALYIVAYSWYQPVHQAKLLWALLGLAVAVDLVARTDPGSRLGEPAR